MRCFIFFCLFILHQPFVAAQEQVKLVDEICLTARYVWDGSLVETANINNDPVPVTYRQRFESTGCSRFQLDVLSLLDWHRQFGNETTTQIAVNYITAPIHRAFANKEIDEGHHFISAHTTLANYYDEGAMAFGSEALIEKAFYHAQIAQRASKETIVENSNGYNYRQYSDLGIGYYRIGDKVDEISRLIAKIAARKAYITGMKSDVGMALKYFSTDEAVVFNKAIDWIKSEHQPLCEGRHDVEATFEGLCDQFGGKYQDLIDYKISLFLLTSFDDDFHKGEEHLYDIERLIQISEVINYDASINVLVDRQRFHLHLIASEFFRRGAQKAESYDSRFRFEKCLKHAQLSAQYAPQYQAPSQWNRAAQQYVLCGNSLRKMLPNTDRLHVELSRGLAYFGENKKVQPNK